VKVREKRVAIECAEDLSRVRKTQKSREREDDEAVLESLLDRWACAHERPSLACWRESLGLPRAGVERDDLDVLGKRAARDRELRHGSQLLHAELVQEALERAFLYPGVGVIGHGDHDL